jgi:hypothetical protein
MNASKDLRNYLNRCDRCERVHISRTSVGSQVVRRCQHQFTSVPHQFAHRFQLATDVATTTSSPHQFGSLVEFTPVSLFAELYGTPPLTCALPAILAARVPRCRPLTLPADFRALPAPPLTPPAVSRCGHSIDLPPERRGRGK